MKVKKKIYVSINKLNSILGNILIPGIELEAARNHGSIALEVLVDTDIIDVASMEGGPRAWGTQDIDFMIQPNSGSMEIKT